MEEVLTDGAGGSGPAGGAATLEALTGFLTAAGVQTRAGQAGVVRWDTQTHIFIFIYI